MSETVQKIDIVVKALGTMILKPQFAPSNEIGAPKMQLPAVQEGILTGEDRKIAEEKLIELIKQL